MLDILSPKRKRKVEPVVKISLQKMTEKEPTEGIYTDGSGEHFKSKEDIQREQMYRGEVSVNYPDRYIVELSFDELHEEIQRRAELRQKMENREYNTSIEIKTDRPIAIGWLADIHAGGQDVDYERLRWEIEKIKRNPYMMVFLGGDLGDGYCWNPAQFGDVANIDEQSLYLHRMLEYMGYNKILGAVIGSHEKWARRTGLDMYTDIRKNIPVFDGTGTVTLKVGNICYTGALLHEAKGNSYFNPNHGQKRFSMENEGYDFIMSAHTHAGAEQSQVKQTAQGSRKIVFLSGKTFKRTDDFLDTKGFRRKDGDGIGTNWIVFNPDKKMMRVMSSTSEALETLGAI